jgi:hypothetical protein
MFFRFFRRKATQPASIDPAAVEAPAKDPLRSLQRAGEGRASAMTLCEELDIAIDRGQWDRAHRLAESATRLWPTYRRLAEPLARLRLAQGDATTALMIIDGVPLKTASLRVLRAICLLHEGARDEAHSELLSWTSQTSAPNAARRLCALLDWSIDDIKSARQRLMQNLKQLVDPDTIKQLVLLAMREGRTNIAAHWAERLMEISGESADAQQRRIVLLSMGLQPAKAESAIDDRRIQQLATELLANEAVLPALVEAQCMSPAAATIELLLRAVERALPEMRAARLGRECHRVLARLRDELASTAAVPTTDPATTGDDDAVIAVIRAADKARSAQRRKAA